MKATIPLGRFSGIPIGAHWSVLLTVALLAWLLAVDVLPTTAPDAPAAARWASAGVVAVVFLASLVAHELAHARLAKRFGVRVKGITLWMLGGAATLDDEPSTPKADALVAVAGPATSAVLSAFFLAAAAAAETGGGTGLVVSALVWLGAANLILAVFNLLPASPLDGGRLLRAWLWHRSGDRSKAVATSCAVGRALGTGLIALGVFEVIALGSLGGLWLALVGWFITLSATAERAQSAVLTQLGTTTVADAMSANPVVAPGWWTVDAFARHVASAGVAHRVFPVLDFGGAPIGLVSLHDLGKSGVNSSEAVRSVARPLDVRATAGLDEPLADVARRAVLRPGEDAIVVVRDHTLVGLLTATDITRTLELARLGEHPRKRAGSV
ncbi:site-2 protease family protein [Actinokineospora xionganensis]|uniref:Zinc metalloprotease n=1 Tax=Actinokineospora xionganensis TaxID=2684470 RepID=A0ABR7KZL5_9PSEU|nr:site-2 protease family protein [Actinokineospora xionganensis]MBC6445873.1 site-2 protease family protein [Actinokineospora xionganensis]